MTSNSEKITIMQAVWLFISITFSPAMRLVPGFGAQVAKQAVWISPLISCLVLFLLVLLLQRIYKNHNGSFMAIITEITGTVAGKILGGLYLIWVTLLVALYVRYYAERILSAILPDGNIGIFIITMLVLVAYVVRSGIVTVARMNQIILPIIVIHFFLLSFFVFPKVELDNLYPINILDDVPRIAEASRAQIAIWGYLLLLFFMGDQISHKDQIQKAGKGAAIFLFIANTLLLVMTIGTLGYSVTERLPLPYLIVVKQISIFNILQKIESVVVTIWIASDFIIITVFTYIALRMMKSLFTLRDTKPLINIYMVLIYFLAVYLAKSSWELEKFSEITILLNIIFGFIIPFLLFVVAEIRNKSAAPALI